MNDCAIHVENLSKRFRIGKLNQHTTVRDALGAALKAPFRKAADDEETTLWALRDVSFDVSEGEVVGLIGRNGAGKSTLLKILARVTRPTSGYAEVRGRIGSLLEVGTGFHHELSGRENIFLSGAVLGMKKTEILRRFDEIVAFSEVERFLDTPLKHYSSGMQTRLAFAVAAHLEPEILLVDEVLAVGDVAFQKKCLGKMSEVARRGRTILFVSHHMNQIRRLCGRSLWVDAGRIRMDGPTAEVVAGYESAMLGADRSLGIPKGSGATAQFLRWEISEPRGDRPNILSTIGPAKIDFAVELARPIRRADFGVALYNAQRQLMWGNATRELALGAGVHVFSYSFPSLPLKPGAYQWLVSLWEDGRQLDLWDCTPDMAVATELNQHYTDEWAGILNLPSQFVHRSEENSAVEQGADVR